jgi:hypothetical protein
MPGKITLTLEVDTNEAGLLITALRDHAAALKSKEQSVMSQFEIRVSTQGGPVEAAQFGRVARLRRNVRQPDHVLANRSLATRRSRGRGPAKNGWP